MKMSVFSESFVRRMSNMYQLSAKQWSPFVGCEHECLYCIPSFQRQIKRFSKGKCDLCYRFKPHMHRERLTQRLPRTRYMQFIFTCSSGDVAFCGDNDLFEILEVIENNKTKNFLVQSKDPRKAFLDRDIGFPKNLILGTTIESNNDHRVKAISKAPPPIERFKAMVELAKLHQPVMLTCEPIMTFNLEVMLGWVEKINPCMVWIGYNSKPKSCQLNEPSLWETWKLATELLKRGYIVVLKTMRKAWWEDKVKIRRA